MKLPVVKILFRVFVFFIHYFCTILIFGIFILYIICGHVFPMHMFYPRRTPGTTAAARARGPGCTLRGRLRRARETYKPPSTGLISLIYIVTVVSFSSMYFLHYENKLFDY